MSFKVVTGTMGSGMEASKEMVGSQKSPADYADSLVSCDPDVARKISKGSNSGAVRRMTSKERLAVCNLTGFKVEKNLAIKSDMIDKPRKVPHGILYGKSYPERPIMCLYHTDTPMEYRSFGMYCPKCADQNR